MLTSGLRSVALLLLLASAAQAMQASWVPLKAQTGQWLLERAWQLQLMGLEKVRPWPWADTYPVGVLKIPRLSMRQLLLQGASGRNMAWGPTVLSPEGSEDLVISAHRDTHFERLKNLQPGDQIIVTTAHGRRKYQVAWLDIVDSRQRELVFEPGRERLTLVTCYPFDAASTGGPLRLVVTALPHRLPSETQRFSQAGTGRSLLRKNSGLNSLD